MASKVAYVLKTSTDPAATGVEHSFVLDTGSDLIVNAFNVTLVTDANAANRQVHFTFEDANANVYFRVTAGGTQAASLTRQYSGIPVSFAAPAVADTNFVVPIGTKGIFVPAGGRVKTITTSKQATDDYGILTLMCERADGYQNVSN